MQQVGADHDAGAALSCLAVDGGHVQLVLAQPLVQVLAERFDEIQLGGVVVLKRELSHCRGDGGEQGEDGRAVRWGRGSGGQQASTEGQHSPLQLNLAVS